ncbi:hypothetical protein AYL99_11166 [Fonsecaea erecta]|uniref:Uncharacterized protein n=1 Tax=Fonsecaea erecta TaxID=1367422 RepID=A0A178Z4P0_9EURO|nr:hypothetical protein AYL99_11166 [Fonsecaea erecta]OAP54718.1 hypothetical protein AYL99_11166 [Fonsecaea erecta]
MLHSAARRSAARDAVEWEAEDVTAILNEEAANTTRTPRRKSRRASRLGPNANPSPSNGRAHVELPARSVPDMAVATTASPSRRISQRLRKRQSLAGLTPVNRRDIYAIPNNPEPIAVTKPLLEPIKRLRPLNKKSQWTESPFKGKGILDTRTNALVNLDDSPRKRPVRPRIEKIGRSLKKSGRPASKLKETTTATRGGGPLDGEDIFEASQIEDLEKNNPAGHDRIVPEAEEGPSNTEVLTEASMKPFQSEPGGDAGPEIEQRPQAPAKLPHLLAEIAQQALALGPTENDILHEVVEASGEEEAGNAANDHEERAPTPTPAVQRQRPRTQAERDAVERAAAEEKAKREQMVKDALSGIELAVEVLDCKDAWTEVLVAAAEITGIRASSEPESTTGKACARAFRTMAHIYKKLHRGNHGSLRELEDEKRETLNLLRQRCKHICEQRHKPEMHSDRERNRMARDLYEHLIPSSLQLAKRALKVLFQNDTLSLTALKEICRLLNITLQLVESARTWEPRPRLGKAIKSKTSSDIKPGVSAIVENYRRMVVQNNRERFVDELEVRQKLNLERQRAEYQRRKEAAMARYRQYCNHDYHGGVVIPDTPVSSPQRQSVDMGELLTGDEDGLPDSQHREGTGHVRPRINREPTEDIPPPAETEWSQSEFIVLVNALQQYTSESRWEDIIDAYGGPGGKLEKYDMDQIIAKARWVKQTMARQLEDELDRSWDWLRSVPS